MPGARGVCLDYEDSGADAADRELLVTLRRDPLDRDLGDSRGRRPFMQEGPQTLERALGSLGVHAHAAVLTVAHPAQHPELVCPSDRRISKTDALHLTADEGTDGPVPTLTPAWIGHGASYSRAGLTREETGRGLTESAFSRTRSGTDAVYRCDSRRVALRSTDGDGGVVSSRRGAEG